MKQFSQSGAWTFTESIWTLYAELEKKLGSDKAWQFVLKFYEGAGGE